MHLQKNFWAVQLTTDLSTTSIQQNIGNKLGKKKKQKTPKLENKKQNNLFAGNMVLVVEDSTQKSY